MDGPSRKRRRLSAGDADGEDRTPRSLSRAISPPKRRRNAAATRTVIPSPFHLTAIRDLPPESNVDAVGLKDLIGDPLIAECWEFNYLHDVDFLMSHLDEDTRSLTKVHIVHGFWKREDPNKIFLEKCYRPKDTLILMIEQQQASQYENVELHTAFMPEMFGTHHSKMLILLRHDDTAQVIIHTANMIAKDWTNLTNGVWQSPLLPLSRSTSTGTGAQESVAAAAADDEENGAPIGSGARFKADLLAYLRAYNAKRNVCGSLVDQLRKYDFSAVRGALVASVPGKHDVQDAPSVTRWGWAAAKHVLRTVPSSSSPSSSSPQTESGAAANKERKKKAEIVAQISSIATLGANDTWLQRTLFEALSASATKTANGDVMPEIKVVFPTPDEIRRSLDGYASGGSIHMKIQSAQQQKQLQYMRPILCHWANDSEKGILQDGPITAATTRDGGRNRAAPHIKTYIRYAADGRSIDWALLTSANISKQAWGEAANGSSGQIRIASWEIGVLVWPSLLANGDKNAKMIGTFKTDMAGKDDLGVGDGGGGGGGGDNSCGPFVSLRIPYSLPLKRYAEDEMPWVATANYSEPDWKGRTWEDP